MSDNLLICGHCIHKDNCIYKAALQQKIRNSRSMFQGRENEYIQPEVFCRDYIRQDLFKGVK